MITLIEHFCEAKSGIPELCEDCWFVGEHFAVVADGATSVFPASAEQAHSPGRLAAEAIVNTLQTCRPEMIARDALRRAGETIRMIPRLSGQRCAATTVIYSNYRREIWRVGDCQFLMNGKTNSYKMLVDIVMADARALILECDMLAGASLESLQENDSGRQFILPAMRRQHLLENNLQSPFGYSVMNGCDLEDQQIEIFQVQEDIAELVLASDGYPVIKPTLEATEAELAALLDKDPLLFRDYRSTKGLIPGHGSFDDRTYLRIGI